MERKFIIVNELTGETYETYYMQSYNAVIEDIINNYGTQVYYNPIGNETTAFLKPIKIVKEYYTIEENDAIEEKATITTYKTITNPYAMD